RVAAVEDVGNGPQLVIPEGDGRVHAAKGDVGPVVFTGPGGVHFLIVLMNQSPATFRVPPNPVLKGVPDGLLLLGGQGGVLGVQHPAVPAFRVRYGIVDTHIPQVQAVLQNLVGVGAAGSIGGVS